MNLSFWKKCVSDVHSSLPLISLFFGGGGPPIHCHFLRVVFRIVNKPQGTMSCKDKQLEVEKLLG